VAPIRGGTNKGVMKMAVAEISVVPVGAGASISDYVVRAIEVVRASGLKYELSAMGTNVEGEVSAILELAGKIHQSCFDEGAVRVLTAVKIDDRRDKQLTIESKRSAVKAKLR
jgi:uncharacterized protein (TIGR00106 family)